MKGKCTVNKKPTHRRLRTTVVSLQYNLISFRVFTAHMRIYRDET